MNTKRSIFCLLFFCCQIVLATTFSSFALANTDEFTRQDERPQETLVDLTIEISVNSDHLDGQGNTAPGGILEYQFTVQNNDALAYEDIVLSTIVPDYTKFDQNASQEGWSSAVDTASAAGDGAAGTCPQDAGPDTECIFRMGTLESGESATITFVVQVDKPIFIEETIFNLLASVHAQHASTGSFVAAEELQVGLSTPTAIQEILTFINQLYLPFISH